MYHGVKQERMRRETVIKLKRLTKKPKVFNKKRSFKNLQKIVKHNLKKKEITSFKDLGDVLQELK